MMAAQLGSQLSVEWTGPSGDPSHTPIHCPQLDPSCRSTERVKSKLRRAVRTTPAWVDVIKSAANNKSFTCFTIFMLFRRRPQCSFKRTAALRRRKDGVVCGRGFMSSVWRRPVWSPRGSNACWRDLDQFSARFLNNHVCVWTLRQKVCCCSVHSRAREELVLFRQLFGFPFTSFDSKQLL